MAGRGRQVLERCIASAATQLRRAAVQPAPGHLPCTWTAGGRSALARVHPAPRGGGAAGADRTMSSTSTIPNEDARGLGNMGLNLVKMCMMISLTGLMWNCRHVLWQAVFDSGVQLIRTARDASIVSSGVKRARDRLESRELCDLLFKPGPERLAEGKSAIEILLSVHLRNQSVELQQEVLLLIEKVLEVDGAAQLRTAGAERALSEAAREMRGEDQQVKALALVAALQAAAE